jgi:hypothetical protein
MTSSSEHTPLDPTRAPVREAGLVDVATVAEYLGIKPAYVYEHADELGARRLGPGPRARLRFSLAEIDERLSACSASRESSAAQGASQQPLRRGKPRPLGTNVELLPIRARIREAS